jgi:hypothetical protein
MRGICKTDQRSFARWEDVVTASCKCKGETSCIPAPMRTRPCPGPRVMQAAEQREWTELIHKQPQRHTKSVGSRVHARSGRYSRTACSDENWEKLGCGVKLGCGDDLDQRAHPKITRPAAYHGVSWGRGHWTSSATP